MTHLADNFADRLIEMGRKVRKAGPGKFEAQCCAHDDRAASLSIGTGDDGRILLRCFAGCAFSDIVAAAGWNASDCFPAKDHPGPRHNGNGKPKPAWPKLEGAIDAARRSVAWQTKIPLDSVTYATHWTYHNADGEEVLAVARFNLPTPPGEKQKKTFRPVQRVAAGWALGDPPGKLPLYGLVTLADATRVYVMEGEAKTDAAIAGGLVVTTSAHGAESAGKTDWTPLARVPEIVIVPDHDEAGNKFERTVGAQIFAVNPSAVVKVVRLAELAGPEFPEHGDYVEFARDFRDGHDAESIRDEIQAAADRATPLNPEEVSEDSADDADANPIEIVSAGQLIHSHPEHKPVLVNGLFRRGEVVNVIAAPKTGKTHAVHCLAMAAATGGTWFGYNVRQCRVLMIDNELHPQTLARRLDRIAQYFGIKPDEISKWIDVVSLRGKLRAIDKLAPFFAGIEAGRYGIIIFDSLYRALPKDTDENSNVDITQLYNLIDRYAAQVDSAFVLIHHTSKGVQGSKGITDVGAGAGAQSRAADTHIVLREHESPGVIVFDAVVRSFEPPTPSCWRREYPIFVGEPTLDPATLKRERPARAKKQTTAADAKPKPEPWTPKRFAGAFITKAPKTLARLQGEAAEVDITNTTAERLTLQAVAMELCHRWDGTPGKPSRFSTVPQPLIDDSKCPSLPPSLPPTPPSTAETPTGVGFEVGETMTKPKKRNSRKKPKAVDAGMRTPNAPAVPA